MLQILELKGNLDIIWPNLSLRPGEKAEAWNTELTSARLTRRKWQS